MKNRVNFIKTVNEMNLNYNYTLKMLDSNINFIFYYNVFQFYYKHPKVLAET